MLDSSIEMLRQIILTGDHGIGKRDYQDIAADRLRQAATQKTLLACMNKLAELLSIETQYLRHDTFAAFVSDCGDVAKSRAVLAWMREYPKIAVMLATIKEDAERAKLCTSIEIKPMSEGGSVAMRGNFDIPISVTLLEPLAHGADIKSGNATLFRRVQVLDGNGTTLSLPIFAGNALRGLLRRALAGHLVKSLGLSARKGEHALELWFFYMLYSGGALEEGGKATKAAAKELGDNGATICQAIHKFRDMLPGLSLLGGAMGNRIISGRVQVCDLRPLCVEWGNGGACHAEELFDWTFLTRREDDEEHEQNHSMIANTEVLKAGTILEGGIDIMGHASELERAALDCGLEELQRRGYLGAESRRGFGKCKIDIGTARNSMPYRHYLEESKKGILDYLQKIRAIPELKKGAEGDTDWTPEKDKGLF